MACTPETNATTTSSTKQFIAGVEVVAVKLFRIFSVAVDFEAGGVAEEPGQARRERRARRNERFASAMQATRSLAELIKGSRGKFADVLQEMELVVHVPLEVKYAMTRERPDAAGTDPVTGEVSLNPSQVRRVSGHTDSWRQRYPGGRWQGAQRSDVAKLRVE